jgi:hypothetical protein
VNSALDPGFSKPPGFKNGLKLWIQLAATSSLGKEGRAKFKAAIQGYFHKDFNFGNFFI